MIKEVTIRTIEFAAGGLFAILAALVFAIYVTKADRNLPFKETKGLATAQIFLSPSEGSNPTIRLSGIGSAVYAGPGPRVLIRVMSNDMTLISNHSTNSAHVQSQFCQIFSGPELKEYQQAPVVTSTFHCEAQFSKLEAPSASIHVLMSLRSESWNAEGTPTISASGSYEIDGGLLANVINRIQD